VAGVFASNFVNHMLYLAKNRLDKKQIDFNLIEPLLRESVRKAMEIGPRQAQTGPARRKDEKTLNEHFDLLPAGSMESQLYKLISESIAKTYHQEG
jgi:hypothetical protein